MRVSRSYEVRYPVSRRVESVGGQRSRFPRGLGFQEVNFSRRSGSVLKQWSTVMFVMGQLYKKEWV